jgi:hypothetical protein
MISTAGAQPTPVGKSGPIGALAVARAALRRNTRAKLC